MKRLTMLFSILTLIFTASVAQAYTLTYTERLLTPTIKGTPDDIERTYVASALKIEFSTAPQDMLNPSQTKYVAYSLNANKVIPQGSPLNYERNNNWVVNNNIDTNLLEKKIYAGNKLIESASSQHSVNFYQAVLQLAIWESVYGNVFDHSQFKYSGMPNSSQMLSTAFTQLYALMDQYEGSGEKVKLYVLSSSDGHMPLLLYDIGSPVPVPAAAWLLGTGVAGLVALKRRKAKN